MDLKASVIDFSLPSMLGTLRGTSPKVAICRYSPNLERRSHHFGCSPVEESTPGGSVEYRHYEHEALEWREQNNTSDLHRLRRGMDRVAMDVQFKARFVRRVDALPEFVSG